MYMQISYSRVPAHFQPDYQFGVHLTVAPRLRNFSLCFFRRRRRQIAAGADYGGASPAHVPAT
eukprot:COSAG06_NODE_40965_length_396_cov_1.309764_1_plen_62_part_01